MRRITSLQIPELLASKIARLETTHDWCAGHLSGKICELFEAREEPAEHALMMCCFGMKKPLRDGSRSQCRCHALLLKSQRESTISR